MGKPEFGSQMQVMERVNEANVSEVCRHSFSEGKRDRQEGCKSFSFPSRRRHANPTEIKSYLNSRLAILSSGKLVFTTKI